MERRERKPIHYNFYECDHPSLYKELGKDTLKEQLKKMLLIRHFEMRGEAAYQHGKVGGFYHAYMGQEAIQTAAVCAMGVENNWWITTYRCHALALLTGCSANEGMAELYGKTTGNAKGRGGSMHLFTDRMLGGFGIVGGHVPIAAGAAFSLMYLKQKGVAVCFLGDGAVAQGAFHESLNLTSLWDLPIIYVIENNQWGMGTGVERAIAAQPIAEKMASSYDMKGYSVNGLNFITCYGLFSKVYEDIKRDSKPVLIEAVTERFRGHSISDPGLYRSKEELKKVTELDPIISLKEEMEKLGYITDAEYHQMNEAQKQIVLDAVEYAENSPDPDPDELEEDVFAPWQK